METDKLHQITKNLHFSEATSPETEAGLDSMESYLRGLKQKESKKLRLLSILFFIGALFFLALLLLPLDAKTNMFSLYGRGLLFAAYLAIAVLALHGRRDILKEGYSLPVLNRLRKMQKRFRFFNPKLWYIYPMLIMVDAAGTFSMLGSGYVPAGFSIGLQILFTQLVFLFILVIGFYFGYEDWKKNRKEQFEQITRYIRELEGS